MKIKDLKPAEYNPRKITDEQLERLKKALHEFGDLSGLVFNKRTGNLVGGHQRLKCLPADAVIEKKALKVPSRTGTIAEGCVIIEGEKFVYREIDWDLQREKAANIAANKQGGEWDDDKLAELLKELSDAPDFDIDLTGFDDNEISGILSSIAGEGLTDPDEVPDVPTQPHTKPGDLYILGKHRLLCGDATKKADVEGLMDGKKADMVFTDPPYGVSYAAKNEMLNAISRGNRIQTPIEGDHNSPEDMSIFWKNLFTLNAQHMRPGACYYVTGPQGGDLLLLLLALKDSGFVLRHMLIWAKNNHVLGRCDYNYKHEPIIYGWIKGSHKYYGPANETSLWEINKPLKSDLHPTMKPIELIERAIFNSSLSGEIINDNCAGSGTAFIACEKTGRICYGMEIDPHYCDVIVTRYCKYTGNNKIIKNGKEFKWQI